MVNLEACANCRHLRKDYKEEDHTFYRYGCNKNKSRYIHGWIKKDSELKQMNCSDWKEKNEQLKLW